MRAVDIPYDNFMRRDPKRSAEIRESYLNLCRPSRTAVRVLYRG